MRRKAGENSAANAFDAEFINPDNVRKYGGGKVVFKGVPIRYQHTVSAYFKRIADEQKELKSQQEGDNDE